jgi:tetratricopeptide (TPR) repeat protein
LEEALSVGQQALDCYWSSVGPADSFAAVCLRFMLQCHKDQGDRERHLTLLRNASRVCDQQLGPLHATTLELVESRVALLTSLGWHRDAGVVANEWLERVRQPDGGMPAVSEKLLRQHSIVLRGIPKLDKAEVRLRELLALHDARQSDTLQRQADLSDMAEVLIHLERPAEALPMLQQVIKAFEERGAEGTPRFTQYELGRARQRLEMAKNALAAPTKATAAKKDSVMK